MTFNASTERWDGVCDGDVWQMLKDGFNSAEIAHVAHVSVAVAEAWVRKIIQPELIAA